MQYEDSATVRCNILTCKNMTFRIIALSSWIYRLKVRQGSNSLIRSPVSCEFMATKDSLS